MTDSLERRVECPRHHWLFDIIAEGIEIKCRGCHTVYVIAWEEIEVKRQKAIEHVSSLDRVV